MVRVLSWGGLVLLTCISVSATAAEEEACHNVMSADHESAEQGMNLLQRNSSQASPVSAIEAEASEAEASDLSQEPEAPADSGSDGQAAGFNGIRMELYLRPPLRYIHNSQQGPIGAFMAELKARILYALDLPPEQVQMLGIRGQSLGKDVDFNMLQVSDSTYINATFSKTEKEYFAMLEANQTFITNSSKKGNSSQEPIQYNKPVVIEGVIRPAGSAATSAERTAEPGPGEAVIRKAEPAGESAPRSESKVEEAAPADNGYSSGWRTDDDWRSKLGTVDPNTWDWRSMSVSGSLGGFGGDGSSEWRSWDPRSGKWTDSTSSYSSSESGSEGGGEGGGESRPAVGSGFNSNGGYLSWGGSGEGDSSDPMGREADRQYDGMSYQTVVDFEVMPGYGGEAPVWVAAALREETLDPNGRLMRGSLAPILSYAKLMVGGQNRGTVESLLQESAAHTTQVSSLLAVFIAVVLAVK